MTHPYYYYLLATATAADPWVLGSTFVIRRSEYRNQKPQSAIQKPYSEFRIQKPYSEFRIQKPDSENSETLFRIPEFRNLGFPVVIYLIWLPVMASAYI